MPSLLSYKSLGQMQQSLELLQQSWAAVPLRSPVRVCVEKSSEDGTNFRRALRSTSCAGSRSNSTWSPPRYSECRAAPAFSLDVNYCCTGIRQKIEDETRDEQTSITSPLPDLCRSLLQDQYEDITQCARNRFGLAGVCFGRSADLTRCDQMQHAHIRGTAKARPSHRTLAPVRPKRSTEQSSGSSATTAVERRAVHLTSRPASGRPLAWAVCLQIEHPELGVLDVHAASRPAPCKDPSNSASKSRTISWSKRAAIGSVVSCARIR